MIENKTAEKQEKSSVKLTVTVASEAAEKAYNDLLAKYGKQIQIPGFRKGKVPKEVIVRKFGEGIKQEAAADILDKALQEALSDVEEAPISQPVLNEMPELKIGEKYEFSVTYDVFPEIKLGEYKGIEIEEPQVKILKKHEDAELEKIREQNAVVTEKKDGEAADGDVITMDYVELNSDDSEIPETARKDFVFTIGKNPHPYSVEEEIKGMKAGEEKIIEKTFPEDSDSPYAGKTIKLKVKITTIKERQLPDLDDELAQDVGEEYKTLDDLRKKIRKDLKKNAEIRIRNKKINDISDKLVETSEITVPESMIKNELERSWKDYVNQSGVQEDLLIKVLEQAGKSKDDILNEWRDGAEKSIKRQLIYGKIIEEEKIEASAEEIEEKMKQNAEEFGMSVEDVEKMFGGEQYKEYLKGEIVQDKLYDLLIENAVIKKGDKIDYNDLINA